MYTILLADDDEAVRVMCSTALREHGYTVLEAGDGHDALSLACNHPARIDLLIADLAMPRLGGLELCVAFKDVHPEAGVLFISGHHAEELDSDASFLQKPFTPDVLLHRANGLLSCARRQSHWSGQ